MSVSEEIIKVLDALAEKFGIAVNWTADNVAPYAEMLCQKLVKYEIATSIFWIVIGICFLILSIWLLHKTKEWYGKADWGHNENGYEYACIFAGCGVAVAILVGVIVIPVQAFDIVKCFTFPEMVIFEELKSLLSSTS